ncbi:Panacea domain-containing protein [Allokutzneria sp. NRRL B-24872]|uniref:Panacea domain-containing protein n=1 Tax=Allokutzneria sp. NRRL B-24872 TaxID=1137961 RepID=UPI001AEF59FB|nr:type II toxin-antitoxin system antitoxin SocA domain-containing protein [Allokutzneria sp. NRRL B-24872]
MNAKYDATTIAKWFIAWADHAENASMSNLKLQKILYYAQGHHVALHGEPLFSDEIQAWSHGPVVPTVYRKFRDFGAGEIKFDEHVDFSWDDVDEEATRHLMLVWNTYGGFAAWRLRNMTHDDGPWKDHFVDGERNLVIPVESLREHFSSRTRVSEPRA